MVNPKLMTMRTRLTGMRFQPCVPGADNQSRNHGRFIKAVPLKMKESNFNINRSIVSVTTLQELLFSYLLMIQLVRAQLVVNLHFLFNKLWITNGSVSIDGLVS